MIVLYDQVLQTPPRPPTLDGRSFAYTYNRTPRGIPTTPSISNQLRDEKTPSGLVKNVLDYILNTTLNIGNTAHKWIKQRLLRTYLAISYDSKQRRSLFRSTFNTLARQMILSWRFLAMERKVHLQNSPQSIIISLRRISFHHMLY